MKIQGAVINSVSDMMTCFSFVLGMGMLFKR